MRAQSSRPASAPSRRGRGALYSANAKRKEGNSFAGQEITILRDAQLTSIGDGVGRTRTIPPSYMSSSDWSKGAEAAIPHDYTTIPDRPFLTNKDDTTIMSLAEKLGVVVYEHEHSAGMLGLERSKAAFAAVRQRFDECENEKNIKWFEGHSFHASGLYGSKDQPIEYSPSGKVKNRKLKYSDVLREFENRVQRGRSFSSTQSGFRFPPPCGPNTPRSELIAGCRASRNLSVDFLSDHIDDLLNLSKVANSRYIVQMPCRCQGLTLELWG